MPDAPAVTAVPAGPASTTPAITFGGGSSTAPVEPKAPPAETPAAPPAEESSKFEFSFDGDDEKYFYEEKPEDTQTQESYDATKPFSPEAEAALKDHPELLKLFKQQHYEMRQWKALGFKSPAEVKAFKSRIDALGGPDAIEKETGEWSTAWAGLQAGDPAVFDGIVEEHGEGMVKLSGHMLDWLKNTAPSVWAGHMAKTFMSTLLAPNAQGVSTLAAFNQLYDIPEIANSPAAQKLLKQMAETINSVSKAAEKTDQNPQHKGPDNRERDISNREHGVFLKEVNMKTSPLVDSAARQAVKVALKGLTISKDVEVEILADVKRQFNTMQKGDKTFQENARDLLIKRDTDRFLKVLKSAIARNMPRAALREARKYKGLSGSNATRKAEGQARTESGGGGAAPSNRVRYTGPFKQGGPDPAMIDYQMMRAQFGRKGTDEMLSQHQFIKKGADPKQIYFW